MTRILAALFLFLGLAVSARAQDIVAELSQYDIELTPSFKGQDLFIFGAIKQGQIDPAKHYDIVVVIQGEDRANVVRKKERVFGLWLNTQSQTIRNVPDFYGQASTRPLEAIADAKTLTSLGLGIEELDFIKAAKAEGGDAPAFAEGLIKAKEDDGLFQTGTNDMPVMAGILFRADFFFRPNVPSGSYEAKAYLFEKGKLVGQSAKVIQVSQVGLERALYNLAHDNPAFYGILAIIIALSAGWLAGYITRGRAKIG